MSVNNGCNIIIVIVPHPYGTLVLQSFKLFNIYSLNLSSLRSYLCFLLLFFLFFVPCRSSSFLASGNVVTGRPATALSTQWSNHTNSTISEVISATYSYRPNMRHRHAHATVHADTHTIWGRSHSVRIMCSSQTRSLRLLNRPPM